MASQSTSISSDDIIPSTPAKNIKLGKFHTCKKPIPSTSRTICDEINDPKGINWQCNIEETIPVIIEFENDMKKKLKGKVYMFHRFNEIFKYRRNKVKNNLFKVIGRYEISDGGVSYIKGYEANEKNLVIILNVSALDILPTNNDVLEIFGHLEFQNIKNMMLPIITVHFYSKIDNASGYINCLKQQRKCLIEDNSKVEMEHETTEDDTLMTLLQDLSLGIISTDLMKLQFNLFLDI
ncbi:hypothetical protein HHI36_020921 [Cryptolaemus montrouzieri]|uniref:Uncharacterized protein n=1 Tax=Cryptolaemus montrouzieri TaxID=559131 RepID=A0ABD2NC74_9CUCU